MTTLPVPAVVVSWRDVEGWGVVECPATPGGCWVHWSAVAIDGYRSLAPGTEVLLEWEAADQDGYAHRALRVWPAGQDPVEPPSTGDRTVGYASTLALQFDAVPDPTSELPAGAFTARTGPLWGSGRPRSPAVTPPRTEPSWPRLAASSWWPSRRRTSRRPATSSTSCQLTRT